VLFYNINNCEQGGNEYDKIDYAWL
jgi:hypothetical protein